MNEKEVCDGQRHFRYDGKDEVGCKNYTCPEGYAKCDDNEECFDLSKVCDGERDCMDRTDEQGKASFKQ